MPPAKATSIRPLARLLAEPLAIWLMGGDGRLLYVSASCGVWLGVDPQRLIGHGAAVDLGDPQCPPLDALAVSLRPNSFGGSQAPISQASTPHAAASVVIHRIHPIAAEPREVLFIPLPDGGSTAWLAIAGVHVEGHLANGKALPDQSGSRGDYVWVVEAVARQLAIDPRQASAPIVLGASPWAERLRHQMDTAAATSFHVTLYGPSGGGAEAIARLIHTRTSGKNELVKVAGSLMDAELFDATTGDLIHAFLDDSKNTAALLVLDIDQMPADAQQRLALLLHNYGSRLRIYTTSEIEPNRLAPTLVPELVGLGMLEIFLPPLSFRVEDLAQIAAALLHRRQVAGETTARQIGREALDRLLLYPWPGNYEELEAAIRHAARQCRGETLRVEHLPLAIRSHGRVDDQPRTAIQPKPKIGPLADALAETERRCLAAALEQTGGNRAAAARLLDISRPKLLRRIEQLAIEASPDPDEEDADDAVDPKRLGDTR